KIASKLAPTKPLESITYFVFGKSELASRSFDLPPIAAFVPRQRRQAPCFSGPITTIGGVKPLNPLESSGR
ncbi:hypothetical protein, partial [Pseudomonas helleri]|uniref:hypothetical protein n=2 Tax=Pseudomonas helleri TaxID=1608996 RepID=UPI003FCF4465